MSRLSTTAWTLALAAMLAAGAGASAAAAEADFRPLFDGKSLDGWDGNPKLWRVEDGAITGQTTAENPTQGNTFLIWRGGEVGDFELRLKFRIDGGNSGIQYRSQEVDRWVISGYQADFDAANQWSGTLYEERGRGILARRGQKVVIDEQGQKQAAGPTTPESEIVAAMQRDDWNDYTITARGNHLVQVINGKVTVDVVDNQAAKRAMSGLLALQLHAGPPMKVQFKDIQLKQLSAPVAEGGAASAPKKVVFIAGRPSHGYGAHEHHAGCLLLARCLEEALPGYKTEVFQNGWPQAGQAALEGADAIVVYCDGGGGHLLLPHVEEMYQLMNRGTGLVCLHYGVEVPKGRGGDALLDWIGGYFEADWSVNPHWTATFKTLPDHPVGRGVKPFSILDEWYYHLRFRPEMQGVTGILSDLPPQQTLSRPDGPHSGNPQVRAAVARGEAQHLGWAAEREGGGRGFGFTGGHFHWNWGHNQFRKAVLNAIVWAAHGEVPAGGVPVRDLTVEELMANQDEPVPNGFDKAKIAAMLAEWNRAE